MDPRRLRSGELLAAAGAIGLAVVLFVDWFGGQSGWSTLTVGRVLLVLTIALALTFVFITLSARAVSMATSSATVTVGCGTLTLLYLLFRVGIDEPGVNARRERRRSAPTSACSACWRSSPAPGGRSPTSAPAARSRCARPSACSPSAARRGRRRRSATRARAAPGS